MKILPTNEIIYIYICVCVCVCVCVCACVCVCVCVFENLFTTIHMYKLICIKSVNQKYGLTFLLFPEITILTYHIKWFSYFSLFFNWNFSFSSFIYLFIHFDSTLFLINVFDFLFLFTSKNKKKMSEMT